VELLDSGPSYYLAKPHKLRFGQFLAQDASVYAVDFFHMGESERSRPRRRAGGDRDRAV